MISHKKVHQIIIKLILYSFILSIFQNLKLQAKISPLADKPDWSRLDPFQYSISKSKFLKLLNEVYAPHNAWSQSIRIFETHALILTGDKSWDNAYKLHYATQAKTNALNSSALYWLQSSKQTAAPSIQTSLEPLPLNGRRIAIDPGHLGGSWAKMEERWFQIGKDTPVTEGDMTLRVALLIKEQLEQLGATVLLTRQSTEPVTSKRPADFVNEARQQLISWGISNPLKTFRSRFDPKRIYSTDWRSQMFFYRISEIRARSKLINQKLKPELALCLHFNAESWGDPSKPTLVDKNHFHILINGTYMAGELEFEDSRFEMMYKILSQVYDNELKAAKVFRHHFVKETSLPPFIYHGKNATALDSKKYIWSRNLIANRLFNCPTLFLEPYVMNSRDTYAHINAGEYVGTRSILGRDRKNIYKEYADTVVKALIEYYRITP
ncbi:MAG: N-acetylmuramoyl-L-alanine amidase [Verrucomicrobiota bacterium]